jgi:ABC-type microcin C transport system permease subunit YejE
MFRLNPQTAKKVRRFKAIKRGYYSFLAVAIVVVITAFGELLVNSRALFVSYEGDWYFPTYTKFHPGTDFGLDYDYEVDYRALRAQWQEQGSDNWLLMPLVPYNPFENDARDQAFKPTAPSWSTQHYLGTDSTSRDILARLRDGILRRHIRSLVSAPDRNLVEHSIPLYGHHRVLGDPGHLERRLSDYRAAIGHGAVLMDIDDLLHAY